jgi:hypothetical protein
MTRIMGDSTTFLDIPKSVEIVGVYGDGRIGVVTAAELEAHFPHAQYGWVFFDVNGSRPELQARDWETGDKGGSLEQWVIDHNKSSGKKDAVVYCNRSTIPEVRYLTGSQILGKDYFLFVATLDGSEYTGPGIIACQCDGEKQTGGHWDRSKVYADWFGKPTGVPAHIRPDCTAFQKAVRTPADNLWGPATDVHAITLIQAALGRFPYGVKNAQSIVGTTQDGIWGPLSKAALKRTVVNAQNALDSMGFDVKGVDGIWGPNTQAAYTAARTICHI